LPIGLQIITAPQSDARALSIGAAFETFVHTGCRENI
jgi:Asp-tRNA(Asn)/Glu-tRNA(Gln) amidotransferase A subunit family amidase